MGWGVGWGPGGPRLTRAAVAAGAAPSAGRRCIAGTTFWGGIERIWVFVVCLSVCFRVILIKSKVLFLFVFVFLVFIFWGWGVVLVLCFGEGSGVGVGGLAPLSHPSRWLRRGVGGGEEPLVGWMERGEGGGGTIWGSLGVWDWKCGGREGDDMGGGGGDGGGQEVGRGTKAEGSE